MRACKAFTIMMVSVACSAPVVDGEIPMREGDGAVEEIPTGISEESTEVTPEYQWQLTFIGDKDNEGNVYAVNVGCLDEENPCISSPELLFSLALDIRHISWSPNGQLLAVEASPSPDEETDILIIKADGGEVINITDSPESEGFPSWSPDGQWVAFSVCSSGYCNIEAVNPQTLERRILVDMSDQGNYPLAGNWGAAGEMMAYYAANKAIYFQVYIANTNTGEISVLTDGEVNHTSPQISPDGKRVVFTEGREADGYVQMSDLVIVGMYGTGKTYITNNKPGIDVYWPMWSPDGEWICFIMGTSNISDIYIIRSDGSAFTQVTFDPVEYRVASWRNSNQ